MKINERIKNFIRSYLNVQERNMGNTVMIQKNDDLRVSQLMSETWYGGKPAELQQFYSTYDDGAGNSSFWKGLSSTGMAIRKVHTGLPALIVDKITNIVVDDMADIVIYSPVKGSDNKPIKDVNATQRWEDIAKEHDFKAKILKDAVRQSLLGDSAFKISIDTEVSDYPIIEVKKGRDFDILFKRGRIQGIDFFSHHLINKQSYFLEDHYTPKQIYYSLYDKEGRDVTIGGIEEFKDLQTFEYDHKMLMAIPLVLSEHSDFPGRGKSILQGKDGAFDSLDEVWSQWMDAIRLGRTTKYIPEVLLPKDQNTGKVLLPNSYDNQYIAVGADLGEGAKNEIKVNTPDILASQYLATYVSALDLCLQGLISPSTLGIDVKKLDNAEAQREKEKTTLYTRQAIVERLEKIVPLLVETVLKTDDILNNLQVGEYDVTVDFGGYANPSFEAQVETIGNARQQGIMSLERAIEELYGDSMTDVEKKAEVDLLKLEQGLKGEPAVNEFD